MTASERLSVGCASLDELLGGGLETGTITTVYGPPGAGKTNLALSAAATTVGAGHRVLILDTEGVSVDRLDQLLSAHAESKVGTDRIVIRDIHGFDEQSDAVREAADVSPELALIILDSATGYYRLERTNDEREGDALRELTRQITHLLSVARKNNLAVLLTNQVFTDPDADRPRPLGGHTLSHWAGSVIRLDRFRGGNRRATLEKHRSQPAGETAAFRITETGLESVDRLR